MAGLGFFLKLKLWLFSGTAHSENRAHLGRTGQIYLCLKSARMRWGWSGRPQSRLTKTWVLGSLCHFIAGWLWESHRTSLKLSSLARKTAMLRVSTLWGSLEDSVGSHRSVKALGYNPSSLASRSDWKQSLQLSKLQFVHLLNGNDTSTDLTQLFCGLKYCFLICLIVYFLEQF